MARTLNEHIKRYQSAYATFGLLGLSGDRFQLDRKACFIRRKTISTKAETQEQRKPRGADAQTTEVDPAHRDSDLIRQLRNGKGQRLFITGEGGIGKTEFTRLIALELANQVELQDPVAIPWRFELKEMNGAFENARRFVEERLAPHDHHWLLPLAESGKVVFIFDGLDELGIYRTGFLPVLRDVIERFAESSFVIAGRPGSLGDLPDFPDEARHTLQPLTMPEIRRYVLGMFDHTPGKVSLGQQLMKEIESKRSSLFPIIQQPLILALACHAFSEPNQKTRQHELPANPAELVERALPNIFDRRDIEGKDHDRWLDALSTLAAFTLTESGESVSLSTSREYAKRLLRENPPLRVANDGEARRLLNELAPACGVLAFENGQYTFTNRVLAEFLAARWIVRLGYPNWPYREQGDASINPEKPYTKLRQERERQIMDFLGDHVWTIKRNGLVQAVYFELARTLWGRKVLIHQAHWIHEQIKPFYSGNANDLDVRRTLVSRIFRCVQACSTLSTEDDASVHSLLKQLLDSTGEWHRGNFWTSSLALISPRYSEAYLDQLLDVLQSAAQNPKKNSYEIWCLGNAIAMGWPGNDRALTALEEALAIAVNKPRNNGDAIPWLAHAMANGWPGNNRALSCLIEVWTIARDRLNEYSDDFGRLAEEIARGWAGNDRAYIALDTVLTITKDRPYISWYVAIAMAKGWPGNDRVSTALEAALTIALQKPKKYTYLIGHLAVAMANGWSGKDRAFIFLDTALKIARNRPQENGIVIRGLSKAIAAGWRGHDRAFASLDAAFMIARDKPKKNFRAIGSLAEAMAVGWPGDERAFAALELALTIALDKPKENFNAIQDIAFAMARGWTGNDRAFTALEAALTITLEKPKENAFTVLCLANAMGTAWPGNNRTFSVLDAALTLARHNPMENSHLIDCLAESIASDWPGKPSAACAVVAAGKAAELNIEEWNPWVVLLADEAAVKYWCGERGEKWGLEGDPEFAIVPIPAIIGENVKPKAILIAPRERIRRGLDPALLSHIWQERDPAAFVQPESHAKRPPNRTEKSRFPNGRIGTSEVREVVRQIATTLGYDTSTLAIIMAWTRSKNGTDMMNGAVEVANAVSPDEQAIVPEADPKTGRLSIESADFVTRLSDKAAKKLLAARAAEWANRREVDPWNFSEDDMNNMGSVCPGCGRIDELVRRTKRGEFPVKSPCRSCETKFAEEAICEWPEMCKTCEASDCAAANSNVRFAYPPPPGGWKNKNRKKELCPQCRTPLSRAMPFNRPKP